MVNLGNMSPSNMALAFGKRVLRFTTAEQSLSEASAEKDTRKQVAKALID